MDPNECLQMIRGALQRYEDGTEDDDCESDLVASVRELDEWLSKGGFLPDAWKKSDLAERV